MIIRTPNAVKVISGFLQAAIQTGMAYLVYLFCSWLNLPDWIMVTWIVIAIYKVELTMVGEGQNVWRL